MELFIVYTNESSLLDENMRQLRGQFRFWSLKLENSFFANSLVMAWMVQVVTNFVVHSITAPLSLLQVPRQQRSITAQHCLPPAPLTAGLLLCSIGSLDFLGGGRKAKNIPWGSVQMEVIRSTMSSVSVFHLQSGPVCIFNLASVAPHLVMWV